MNAPDRHSPQNRQRVGLPAWTTKNEKEQEGTKSEREA
jgi:hypothetical protein